MTSVSLESTMTSSVVEGGYGTVGAAEREEVMRTVWHDGGGRESPSLGQADGKIREQLATPSKVRGCDGQQRWLRCSRRPEQACLAPMLSPITLPDPATAVLDNLPSRHLGRLSSLTIDDNSSPPANLSPASSLTSSPPDPLLYTVGS